MQVSKVLTRGHCQVLDSLQVNEFHISSLLAIECVIQSELTILPNKYL